MVGGEWGEYGRAGGGWVSAWLGEKAGLCCAGRKSLLLSSACRDPHQGAMHGPCGRLESEGEGRTRGKAGPSRPHHPHPPCWPCAHAGAFQRQAVHSTSVAGTPGFWGHWPCSKGLPFLLRIFGSWAKENLKLSRLCQQRNCSGKWLAQGQGLEARGGRFRPDRELSKLSPKGASPMAGE